MTMIRALVLLGISLVVFIAGIGLLAINAESGFLSSEARSINSGARTGSNPAPPGPPAPTFDPDLAEELTAIARTLTALPTVAGLTPTPSATVSRLGEPVTAGNSVYTVLQVVDPEPPGLFVTNPGMRRVAIEVRQEASSGTARYSFAFFRLRDDAGDEHSWAITNSEPGFESGDLRAGESRTGWLSFQVPEGSKPAALLVRVSTGYVAIARLD